jgi:hypothetical protein
MQIFDKVLAQIQSVGLPVVAVSLTAVPRANTPVLLAVHWHGFAKRDTLRSQPTDPPQDTLASIPGSAMQISEAWSRMSHLDEAMLGAAWRLGAWDLVREERRGCNTAGASEQEALECRQAFADHPFGEDPDDYMLTEAPDREELMHLGARVGYIRWLFRPVKNGLWQETATDDTLQADGSREPPCPVPARPAVGVRHGLTRYHLGHSSRIVLL